eukprot:5802760-Amphidinium_carterae.6
MSTSCRRSWQQLAWNGVQEIHNCELLANSYGTANVQCCTYCVCLPPASKWVGDIQLAATWPVWLELTSVCMAIVRNEGGGHYAPVGGFHAGDDKVIV